MFQHHQSSSALDTLVKRALKSVQKIIIRTRRIVLRAARSSKETHEIAPSKDLKKPESVRIIRLAYGLNKPAFIRIKLAHDERWLVMPENRLAEDKNKPAIPRYRPADAVDKLVLHINKPVCDPNKLVCAENKRVFVMNKLVFHRNKSGGSM